MIERELCDVHMTLGFGARGCTVPVDLTKRAYEVLILTDGYEAVDESPMRMNDKWWNDLVHGLCTCTYLLMMKICFHPRSYPRNRSLFSSTALDVEVSSSSILCVRRELPPTPCECKQRDTPEPTANSVVRHPSPSSLAVDP